MFPIRMIGPWVALRVRPRKAESDLLEVVRYKDYDKPGEVGEAVVLAVGEVYYQTDDKTQKVSKKYIDVRVGESVIFRRFLRSNKHMQPDLSAYVEGLADGEEVFCIHEQDIVGRVPPDGSPSDDTQTTT